MDAEVRGSLRFGFGPLGCGGCRALPSTAAGQAADWESANGHNSHLERRLGTREGTGGAEGQGWQPRVPDRHEETTCMHRHLNATRLNSNTSATCFRRRVFLGITLSKHAELTKYTEIDHYDLMMA
jgi:hypothetical protein